MEVGMIGLGRMGANMAKRLLQGGHTVIGYNRSPEPLRQLEADGGIAAASIPELVERLSAPRAVWIMLPAGTVTEEHVETLVGLLDAGDTIVDGGNANYQDTMRRAARVASAGLHYVDVGTSGGVWGLAEGYSLMIGGEKEAVGRLTALFETLAPAADLGWGHVGPSGAGHFVKMVHNGIEYGVMQAMAEGFAVLRAKEPFALDLHQVAEVWRHGSVVRSWLLDLTSLALADDQDLADIAPWVSDSGEGRWTVFEAIQLDVPAPVISLSLIQRLRSRDEYSYADRLLAAMRQQFGGHVVRREERPG